MDDALVQAYLNTDYVIDDDIGIWVINIGNIEKTLSRYLHRQAQPTAAFISAANPMSKLLSDKENAQRHQALQQAVESLGVPFMQGYGAAQQGDWPVEKSLFICNLSEQQAEQLARQFQQAAYVWVDDSGLVSLNTCS
ncbi:DUF3293 domain-containing protein [Thalassotalea maritima]|uniref:DUF3293 domain-containing protein n=1 Tax=Thalassotalea maritima TaxID=3242416 RepID=UPI0035270569